MDKNIKKFPTHKVEYGQVNEPDTLAMTYENQTRALEIRAKEIEFEKQEEEHGFEFSKMALEIQLADRKAKWSYNASLQRNTYILIVILFTGVVSLIGTSILLNKESIGIELIKMVAYVSAGSIGGYGVGKSKKKENHFFDDESKIKKYTKSRLSYNQKKTRMHTSTQAMPRWHSLGQVLGATFLTEQKGCILFWFFKSDVRTLVGHQKNTFKIFVSH